MTDELILKKVIEKAIKNGWGNAWEMEFFKHWSFDGDNPYYFVSHHPGLQNLRYESIIFKHEFCKAFFGRELLCYDCGDKVKPPMTVMEGRVQIGTGQCVCSRQFENNEEAWQYHIQMLALSENRIGYLAEYGL